jgi:hypothetical protein
VSPEFFFSRRFIVEKYPVPQEFKDIVVTALQNSPNDNDAQWEEISERIARLPNINDPSIQELIFMRFCRSLQWDFHSYANQYLRALARGDNDEEAPARRNGGHTTPKVNPSACKEIQEIHQSMYDYAIGGMKLRHIKGGDLPRLASIEENQGNGHHIKAEVARRLCSIVGTNQSLPNAISERKLGNLIKLVEKEFRDRKSTDCA